MTIADINDRRLRRLALVAYYPLALLLISGIVLLEFMLNAAMLLPGLFARFRETWGDIHNDVREVWRRP